MKWFANMKIAKKLFLSFAIMLAVSVVVGSVAIVNLTNFKANDDAMYQKKTAAIADLTKIATAFQRMRVSLREVILRTDAAQMADYEQKIADRRGEIDVLDASFSKLITTDDVQKAYDAFLETRKVFGSYLDKIVQLAKQNMNTDAFGVLSSDEVYAAEQNEQDAIQNLVDLLDKEAAAKADENAAIYQEALIAVIVSIGAGIILAILLSLYISSLISGSMKKIVIAAEGIAEGDLDVDVAIHTKDEIGNLAHAFRKMTGNLNDVLSSINAASEQVSTGAKQLSDSSLSLSQGASEQASSIEELTSSLEEISSQTKLNAQNASQANKLAGVAQENAEQGNGQMREMLKSMEDINQSSASISKIIKVIDDIAFQTNILALNAAVEAARAGQHGKGFAVVAEEVRNLAAKSASAAKETTDMIESSIAKVSAGTKLAEHTAEALNKIVDGVAQAAALVKQIDVASNEQAIGLAQINQAVMQVSQVVQANSAVSEQSAAASKELASQAEMMHESVGKFKLKKDNEAGAKSAMGPAAARDATSDTSGKAPARKIALSDEEFGKY